MEELCIGLSQVPSPFPRSSRPTDANLHVAASCQAFLLLGYDQGVMSGLVGADNEFGKQFGHPDATMQGIRKLTPL